MKKRRSVHFVRSGPQLAALTNPSRLAILDRLTALGPMPARKLAKVLNRKTTAIYRHLHQLTKCGLVIRSNATARQRGGPHAVYGPIASVIRVAPEDQAARRHHLARVVNSLTRHAARDFTKALGGACKAAPGPRCNLWAFRLFAQPSKESLVRINKLANALLAELRQPQTKPGRMMSFSLVMAPVVSRRDLSKQ